MILNKLDLTTIILTYNEEMHIRRCLENVCPISKRVIVVDSPSTDKTQEIVSEVSEFQKVSGGADVEVIVHKYPGNQAAQFNWAIDNISIDTAWILRIDADEYLLPELVEELQQKLPTIPKDVTGIELKRRHIFMGKWVKHGIYPVKLLRMFRTGCGRYEERLMDEHISLSQGQTVLMDHDFCDHSLISISDYCIKHINYAKREATELLDAEFDLTGMQESGAVFKGDGHLGEQAMKRHSQKASYASQPLFWRSFLYFIYRYFLRCGFCDGIPGFVFAFVQGWWYRTLVDANIYNAKKACDNDKEKIKNYIGNKWKIRL